MITKSDLADLLVRARKVITDAPGWEDDETTVQLVHEIDRSVVVPDEGRGAYDEGQADELAFVSDDQ